MSPFLVVSFKATLFSLILAVNHRKRVTLITKRVLFNFTVLFCVMSWDFGIKSFSYKTYLLWTFVESATVKEIVNTTLKTKTVSVSSSTRLLARPRKSNTLQQFRCCNFSLIKLCCKVIFLHHTLAEESPSCSQKRRFWPPVQTKQKQVEFAHSTSE